MNDLQGLQQFYAMDLWFDEAVRLQVKAWVLIIRHEHKLDTAKKAERRTAAAKRASAAKKAAAAVEVTAADRAPRNQGLDLRYDAAQTLIMLKCAPHEAAAAAAADMMEDWGPVVKFTFLSLAQKQEALALMNGSL